MANGGHPHPKPEPKPKPETPTPNGDEKGIKSEVTPRQ
jgi:hypothetical protein